MESSHQKKDKKDVFVVKHGNVNQKTKLTSLSSLKLTEALKGICQASACQVRYNDRLTLIAVEVLNEQAAQALLKTTDLCRIPVRRYLALSGPTTVGVIRDVDMDATEEQLEHNLRSENKIGDIRRLGSHDIVTFQEHWT
ncbi:hypothetical protein HPB47_028232 [Ixodes persulcatus]|uniref:Uncharacterized protein n=1 Tax=Ixodes persulcatus TaxID=34615 RepID=A0AC60PUB6_IXOPE|nr:hypothetical protein HPB47_028232 [Ixodes persulcatus]